MIVILKKKRKRDFGYYKNKYGPPMINAFGEATWLQVGVKFVKDAANGNIIERTREVRFLGKTPDGICLYLGPKSKLKDGMAAHPSFL